MRFIAAASFALLFASQVIAADMKFGVVDMSKAFSEYYKTKEAAAKMKANKDKAASEMQEQYDTYKNLQSQLQKKQKEAQDPILTQDARAKSLADFQGTLKEARALEQQITEFQQRRAQQIRQEEVQLQQGLYGEILAVVKDKAKTAAFDFAFDKSGLGITQVPVLLYYKDATDFTDEVIVELNKNAPADAGKAAEPEKKEEPAKKAK